MFAIVCPGQGSQKPGFLFPWLEIQGVQEQLKKLSDATQLDLVHYGTVADEETIKDTAIAQPLIVAAGIIAGRALLDTGSAVASQTLFAGHSVGEVTAAALSGVLTDEQAMQFIRVRAQGMAQAAQDTPSGMAAVLGGVEEDVRAAISEAGLVAANSNGAGQIVAAGSIEKLEAFAANAPARTRVIPLKVAGAFHTDFMTAAVNPLREFAATLSPQDSISALLTNFDGSVISDGRTVLSSLVDQVTRPVRWDLCMETMKERNISAFVELAPAGTLVGLAKRGLRGTPAIALNTPDDLGAAVAALDASE